jgi:hypothetical protein
MKSPNSASGNEQAADLVAGEHGRGGTLPVRVRNTVLNAFRFRLVHR